MDTPRSSASRLLLHTTATCAVLVTLHPLAAHAGPDGGVVTGGSALIQTTGTTTVIQQSSDRAIIRWNSFDVDAPEQVKFQQPSSSSITVNRIRDTKASQVNGKISANGNVVLINPNGIVFGESAVVDVGGLVATTSDLEDDNAFMAGGAVKFTKPGNADAKIINKGTMTIREAGLAGLVAPHVENQGMIEAKMGRVQLASGDIHTIDFAGDGLIKLEVSDDVIGQSVTNSGTIDAEGGRVLVTAAQARGVVDALITNTGTIRANTRHTHKGAVRVEAAKGTVRNNGILQASGDDLGESGGDITVLADQVFINEAALVDVSGDLEGGQIRIGGDYQGSGSLPTSDYLYVGSNVMLNARSRSQGKAGTIILWSDDTTRFYGHADAGGDDGLIEVSGKRYLDFSGTTNLLSDDGEHGLLLLDPTNITITTLANANVSGSSPYTPTADDVTSYLNAATLQAALASGNVIVQTRATGAQPGNITVDAALTWASGNTLTLDAHNQIVINQTISGHNLSMISGGDIQVNANLSGTGALTIQQRADNITMGLGDSATGTLNLTTAEIGRFQNGWADIILGRQTSTAAMNVRALTWNDNLTLRSGSGVITIAAVQTVTAGNNMSIITDGDITLSVSNAITGNSTGTLTVQQATASTTIGLGGTGTINLTSTEIGRMTNNWGNVVIGRTDGTGAINMSTATWNDPLTVQSGSGVITVSNIQTMGSNNLTFVTDADISIAAVTNILYGAGTLAFRQASAGTGIGLGDGQSGILNLTTDEISRFRNGWANIVFGRTDGTAAINLGTSVWNDHLTLQTGSGNINLNATPNMTVNNLSLTTNGGAIAINGDISQTTGNTVLTAGGAGTITTTGAINQTTGALSMATAGGNISVNGAIAKTGGATTIDTIGAGSIFLNNNVSHGSGALSLTTQGADITVTGLSGISQTTGNVTLDTNGGALLVNGTMTQTSGASGALSLNSGNGAFTVNGGITRLAGTAAFDSGTSDLNINGVLNLGAANTTMDASGAGRILLGSGLTQGAGNLSLATAGGNISTAAITQTTGVLTAVSNGGAMNFGGLITKTGGTMDLNSGAGQMTLTSGATLGAGSAVIVTDSDLALNGNLSGTGTLSISQASDNVSMGIGAGQTGTLNINATELDYILDGWTSRTFGRSDSTAGFNLAGGLTWTDALILQSGTGAMNINGAQTMGANAITIRTDSDVNILGNISGTSSFALVQSSAGTSMGIGDGQAGTVHLSSAERAFLQDGFSNRIFGRTDGTGAMNLGGATWVDPLTLRTGTGALNINEAQSMGVNNLAISTDSNLHLGGNVTGTETITITGSAAATSIGLGDGQAGNLLLDNAELVRLGSTWRSMVIGLAAASGDINLGARTWLDPLTLRAGTGNININGNTAMGSNSLSILHGGDLVLNGNLSGSGTLTVAPTTNANSIGLGDGQNGTIALSNAELDRIQDGWGSIIFGTTSLTGSMNVGARTWNDSLTLRTGAGAMNINGAQNMAANNLTLTSSNLAIDSTLTGSGTLVISPSNSAHSIGVGTGQSGTLALSDAELDNIQSGWASVVMGTTSLTGALNIAGRTWNNSMDFRTASGALNINGAQNMGSNNLILRTNTNLAVNYILAGTGTLSILNSGTAATNTMGVGTGQTGQLQLSDTEIDFFRNHGWTNIAFGNSASVGAVNVGANNWNSNVTFRNAGSAGNYININGAQNLGANNLTIASNNDIVINHALNGTGTLSIGQTSATVGLGVGDGQTGAVSISNAELARIGSGWNSLVFGTGTAITGTHAAINVGAYNWNNNVTIRSLTGAININGTQNLGAHDFTILTSANPAVNAAINGTGTLSFIPATVSTTVGIGGTGTLALTEAELLNIGSGWNNLVFGRADGTGAMSIASRTWGNNATFLTGSGLMTIAGATMGNHNLTLSTNSNLAISGGALSGTGHLTIQNSSGLTDIGLAGQTGALVLDNTELGRISDGWNRVTIGSADSFGNIKIGAYNWLNPMVFVTKGNVVVEGAQTTTETSGTAMVFATLAGSFINNAGAAAINPGGGRYLVYSVDEANDTLGGLIRPTILTNQTYAGYGPDMVSEPGDVFLYSGLASKILYLKIDDVDKIYGDTNPLFTYSYIGGLQNGDLLGDIVLSYLMSAAGSNTLDEAGTTRTITGSFNLDGGYTLNLLTGTLTVIKADLIVEADSYIRQYGEANPTLTLSYSGFKNGDSESDLDSLASVMTGATILSDAGSYAITTSGGLDDNYNYIYADGTLTVGKALLTATVQNENRIYGNANPGFTVNYSGFRNGDTQTVINTLATASTLAGATSNVGNYAITASGAFDNNYNFQYVDGNLSVGKATLTATADNNFRVYGDANPALTVSYTGFKNGETASVLNVGATASTLADHLSNVGTYAITASGAFDDNYDFTYNNGTLTVNKATLTVTADNNVRTYGDANPALTVSYSGFKNGETDFVLNTGATAVTLADNFSNAGSHAITASGAVDDNYQFNYVNGALTINKAVLTATANNESRIYGDSNPGFTVTYTGFKNGENDSVINVGAVAGATANNLSHVGDYAITASGASDNNYDFVYADGALSIGKATLTATADNNVRIYGDANPALTVSYAGFKNGENASVINTAAVASTAADNLSGVGSYVITASGASDNNYDFIYADGALTVNKAILTVTADHQSRTYGDTNPALTVSYSGFKNGETAFVVNTGAIASTAADQLSNAGTYAITSSGAFDDNYDFSYVNGALTVNKATLTATAGSGTRAYGDTNPGFLVSYTGFRNGDTVTDIDTLATAAATANGTSNVGHYAVAASGGLDNNYTFAYVNGDLEITRAMLTATANNATRAVGQSNPALTVSYTGFRNGENAGVINTLATATSLADVLSPVGSYAITASGASDNNYDFTYVSGLLNVTAVAAPLPPPAAPVIEHLPPPADISAISVPGHYGRTVSRYIDLNDYLIPGLMVIDDDLARPGGVVDRQALISISSALYRDISGMTETGDDAATGFSALLE